MSVGRLNEPKPVSRRQKVENPCLEKLPRARHADRLDADMVGAGIPMLLDAGADRTLIPPSDNRIEKTIRSATGEIVIAEPLVPPTVDIVLKLHIARKRLARR